MKTQVVGNVDIVFKARQSSVSLCKVFPFIDSSVLHLVLSLQMIAGVDVAINRCRHVSTDTQQLQQLQHPRFPGYRDNIRGIHHQSLPVAVVLLFVVIVVCVDAHCFWSYSLVRVDSTPSSEWICTNTRQNELFRTVVWPAIEFVIGDMAPVLITLASVVVRRSSAILLGLRP